MFKYLVCGWMAFCLAGCTAQASVGSESKKVDFTVIAAGDTTATGEQESRKIELINDQSALNDALAVYQPDSAQYEANFTDEQVLLISMGGRSSSGYSIGVQSVEDRGDFLEVNITLLKPDESCMTAMVMSSPYQLIAVKSHKEILFREYLTINQCH